MGKNTLIRKCLRGILDKYPKIDALMPYIRGNVGFVFTNKDLTVVRDLLLANKVL